MPVQPHRPAWTDQRLDDLSRQIRDGFARNDAEHREFRQEMREMRAELRAEMRDMRTSMTAEMTEGFARVDERFARVDERFDSLQRTLILATAGLVTALIVTILTVAAG